MGTAVLVRRAVATAETAAAGGRQAILPAVSVPASPTTARPAALVQHAAAAAGAAGARPRPHTEAIAI